MEDRVLFVPVCPAPDSLEEQLWASGWPNDGTLGTAVKWLHDQEIRCTVELAGVGMISDLPGADLLCREVLERLEEIAQAGYFPPPFLYKTGRRVQRVTGRNHSGRRKLQCIAS